MTTVNIKKYSLTDEEIKAIETTFKIIKELKYESFDECEEFYATDLSIEDAQEVLQIILENNNINLE